MGRWGLPVNIFAVLWGVGMAVNLAWPREAVYGDALVQHLGCVRLHRRDRRPRSAVVLRQGPQPHRLPGVATRRSPKTERVGAGVTCADAGTFDYVIAGGGTAGCVLAARLSEDPEVTVCLLEAGPSDVGDDNILVLSEWMHLLDSGYDWDYPVEPQERGNSFMRHARGQGAGRVFVAQLVHRVLAARRMPRRVGEDGRHRLERRRDPAAGRTFGEQRRPRRAARPQRAGPDPRRPAGRPVRRRGARGRGDGRVADGGVQPWRDRPQRGRLVPDQRGRGRHPDVDLARVSASDP